MVPKLDAAEVIITILSYTQHLVIMVKAAQKPPMRTLGPLFRPRLTSRPVWTRLLISRSSWLKRLPAQKIR